MSLHQDTIIYTLNQYNLGVTHPSTLDDTSIALFFLFMMTCVTIVSYGYSMTPSLRGSLAHGVCTALVLTLIAVDALECDFDGISRNPYVTGQRCGRRGFPALPLTPLFNGSVTVNMSQDFAGEVRRIVTELTVIALRNMTTLVEK